MVTIRPEPTSQATNTLVITGFNYWNRPDGKGLLALVIDPSERLPS
jgi:hypothetical protein